MKKYAVIAVVAILIIAAIAVVVAAQQREPLEVKVTCCIENVESGDIIYSDTTLDSASMLEMLSSFSGNGVRTSDFYTLEGELGNFTKNYGSDRPLSKTAHYKIWLVVKVTANQDSGNYFDYVQDSYGAITAKPGGVANAQYEWVGTGHATGPDTKIEVNTGVLEGQWLKLGETVEWDQKNFLLLDDGDFMKYKESASGQWKDITGMQINGMKFKVDIGCGFHAKTGERIVYDHVSATLSITVSDWLENHVSLRVDSVTTGQNAA